MQSHHSKKRDSFGRLLLGLGLALGTGLSLNAQTVIASGGNAITGGDFYLGTHAPSTSGLLLTYDDALTNGVVVKFHANQLAAWLWENGTGTASPTTWPSMKLDLSNNLILYNGSNEGVRLDPVNNKLILGGGSGVILTGTGTALSTNGAFTVSGAFTASSGITNTNGALTGGASGLSLNAGNAGQNITFTTPAGVGDIVFNTNGIERARIKSSGYMGIGTASPADKLHVAGNVLVDAYKGFIARYNSSDSFRGHFAWDHLQFGNNYNNYIVAGNTAIGGALGFVVNNTNDLTGLYAENNKNGIVALMLASSGNVGIGTTSPGTKLDVQGGYIRAQDTGANSGAFMEGGNGVSFFGNVGTNDIYLGNSNSWGYLTIKNGGNVGIGTTSPGTKLDVQGGYISTQDTGADSGAFMEGGNGISFFGNFGTNDIYLGNSNSWGYLTIKNGGNVGIGTSSPITKLQVIGPITAGSLDSTQGIDYLYGAYGSEKIFVLGSQYSSAASFLGYSLKARSGATGYLSSTSASVGRSSVEANNGFVAFLTGPTQASTDGGAISVSEKMRIDSNGNVGIGTTNPTQKLSVAGTVRAYAVVVDTGWSDYVFDKDYRLAPLSEVEAHIKAEKHLPGIPSAADVAEHGVSLGDMQSKLLAKVEELTLHLIAQEKVMEAQSKLIEAQSARIQNLETLSASPRGLAP